MIGTECQKIIARIDELLFKIMALTVTIWSVAAGWVITRGTNDLLIMCLVSVRGLWIVAGSFRGAQKRYIERSVAILAFLTDQKAVDTAIETGNLPNNVPVALSGTYPFRGRVTQLLIGMTTPSVVVFYGLLSTMTVVLYLLLPKSS